MSDQLCPVLCANPDCRNLALWKGRCNACHTHLRDHGVEREIHCQSTQQQRKPRQCANPKCGAQVYRTNKGLCMICYAYHYRSGKDRTPNAPKGPAPKEKSACKVCGSKQYLCQRCTRCYHYWKRTGKERPIDLGAKKTKRCANPHCYRRITQRERCGACRKYYAHHGTDRPSHLVNRVTHSNIGKDGKRLQCRNCKQQPAKTNMRCATCANYYRQHGRNRPRYLWDKDAACLGGCGVLIRMQSKPRRGYCAKCYLELREREKAA